MSTLWTPERYEVRRNIHIPEKQSLSNVGNFCGSVAVASFTEAWKALQDSEAAVAKSMKDMPAPVHTPDHIKLLQDADVQRALRLNASRSKLGRSHRRRLYKDITTVTTDMRSKDYLTIHPDMVGEAVLEQNETSSNLVIYFQDKNNKDAVATYELAPDGVATGSHPPVKELQLQRSRLGTTFIRDTHNLLPMGREAGMHIATIPSHIGTVVLGEDLGKKVTVESFLLDRVGYDLDVARDAVGWRNMQSFMLEPPTIESIDGSRYDIAFEPHI